MSSSSGLIVHVIELTLDEPCSPAYLSPTELQCAARFVFDRDRVRFATAHTAIRRVLAHCLDVDPMAVCFALGSRGKPYVSSPKTSLGFNLSHTADRGLLAIADGAEVGVDIEKHRQLEPLALAEHVFSAAERDALRLLDPEQRLEAFFRGWTRKESFVKARGDGLAFPLFGFDVSLQPSATHALLASRVSPEDMTCWTISNLPVEAGYSAAITIGAPDPVFVRWAGVDAFVAGAEFP